MKIDALNCPSCNAPLNAALISANEPFNCPACGSAIVLTDWTTNGKLVCPKCGTFNGSANRSCIACETTLQAGCPFCYTLNRINAITCKNCGVNLQKAWKRQQAWLKQREESTRGQKEALRKEALNHKARLERLLIQLNEPENHPMAIPELLIYGKEAVEPLIKLLDSPDPDARVGAAKALGDIGDKRAIPRLILSIEDEEVAVKFWAVDALGRLKADEAVGAIGELLTHDNQQLKSLAKDVLIQIGTDRAIQILKEKSRRKWWIS